MLLGWEEAEGTEVGVGFVMGGCVFGGRNGRGGVAVEGAEGEPVGESDGVVLGFSDDRTVLVAASTKWADIDLGGRIEAVARTSGGGSSCC